MEMQFTPTRSLLSEYQFPEQNNLYRQQDSLANITAATSGFFVGIALLVWGVIFFTLLTDIAMLARVVKRRQGLRLSSSA